MKKNTDCVRFMNWNGTVIYYDKRMNVYKAAINKDGTDTYFSTWQKCAEAIDDEEDK